MFRYSLLISLGLFLLSLAPAHAVYPIEHLIGKAYDPDSGELIYEEHHRFEYEDQRMIAASVRYVDAAGEQIGQKSLDFRRSASLPAYRTELYGGRFIEGLEYSEDGRLRLYHQKEDGELKSRLIDSRSDMTADAGFNNHVHAYYEQLVAGERVKFRIAVPNQLTTVKFKAEKIGTRSLAGMQLVDFKVAVASLLGLFVDPLVLSYDAESRLLIEYLGLSNVRDPQGELYTVRIRYPQLLPQAEPAASD